MAVGPVTFLAPWVLLGLLALPVIWWLLKVTPPAPKKQVFPPLRILRGVVTEEETPDSTPLWLLLARLLMIALLTVALARPVIDRAQTTQGEDFTLVIDDSWAGAAAWSDITREARAMLGQARRDNARVRLLTSYEEPTDFAPAQAALDRLDRLQPKPFEPRAVAATGGDTRYLSGGIGPAPDGAEVFAPPPALRAVMLGAPEETGSGFRVPVHRAHDRGALSHAVAALGGDATVIATAQVEWIDGATRAEALFDLPSELRNRVTRLQVQGLRSAAAVRLLDDNWGRPVIGVLDVGQDASSPLLSEPFYARTALAPNADIYDGDLTRLLELSPSVIVMADEARTSDTRLRAWVDRGGLLIRFAGENMAERPDDLIPVAVRIGGRALGGALTWEEPQTLAPFPASSPFSGLDIPDDIRVRRQIMAEPGAETDARTWARLVDGSPVVTTDALGQGRIVMFHVTAGPEWSNLAVSGLYVDMLKRLLPLAKANRVAATGDVAEGAEFAAERLLDGFGQLTAPGLTVPSVTEATVASPDNPPGYYRQGSRRLALNAVPDPEGYEPLSGIAYGRTADRRLSGLLLAMAAGLLALDVLFAMIATGRRPRLPRPAVGATAAMLAIVFVPPDALAQDGPPDEALNLYLAYVETGDARLDARSEDAMEGLVEALTSRTTIQPQGVRGVVPGVDPLTFYPFLYFPVRRDTPALDPAATDALNLYMRTGGTVVFDTQDFGDSALTPGVHPGLSQVTQGLDVPRLAPVPEDHVLTKSFYLTQVFPGRWANGEVWVDAGETGGANDGVSSVVIGSNDWAAAWASGPDGGAVVTLENDIPRQREMALRFGVNLGMYALAGNYKGDQVHTARLVERLGTGPGDVVRPGEMQGGETDPMVPGE